MPVCRLSLLLPFLFGAVAAAQTIDGTVIDAQSGTPLASATVRVEPGGHSAAADDAGNFSVPVPAPGPYTVRVTHLGYETTERRVTAGAGGGRLRIELRPTALPGPEIEVSALRARRREFPVTFSDLESQDLRERYTVQDVPVMLSELPSSTFYSEGGGAIGYTYLRLRGFDQRRIAVMVNGIPQNDPEDHNVYWIDFTDLLASTASVQVQRGGGSAFYGPPAIGGSVNLVTGDFVGEKGVRISAGTGSWNTTRTGIAVGSGLVDDRYVFYGRLSQVSTDGYRDHSYVDANAYYLSATRYDPRVTTRVVLYGGPLQDGLAYYGLPKFAVTDRVERRKNYNDWVDSAGTYTFVQPRRPEEHEEFSQPHAELHNEWRVTDALTLHSAAFFVRGAGFFDYDGTGYTDAAYYRLTAEYGFPNAADPADPLIRAYVDNRQFGWLPRMTYTDDANTFTAGLELRRHRSLHWGRIQWAEDLPPGYDPDRHYYEFRGAKDIASAYLQELRRLSGVLTAMADAQFVLNRYRLYDEAFVGTDFTVDYRFLNGRLGLNANLDEHWNAYANVSATRREPRLQDLYNASESSGGETPQFEQRADGSYDFSRPFVRPEQLYNLELGCAYASGAVHAAANAFLMDFRDEIVKSGKLDRFGQPIAGNAPRTLHIGVELAAHADLPYGLSCTVNAMLCRSRLQRYDVAVPVEGSDPPAYTLVSLDGNRIAGFPEALANARLTWRTGGASISASVRYVGDQYTDNFQLAAHRVDPYATVDAIAGYRLPALFGFRSLDVRLAVTNVFDALYAQSGEGDQFFVGAERGWFLDITAGL